MCISIVSILRYWIPQCPSVSIKYQSVCLCLHLYLSIYLLYKVLVYLIYFWPFTEKDRKTMFIALLVTSVLGTLSFLFLRRSSTETQEDILSEEGQPLLSSRLTYNRFLSNPPLPPFAFNDYFRAYVNCHSLRIVTFPHVTDLISEPALP